MKKNKYNLNENHELLGLWWLPDTPKNKIVGILKYDEESGLRLILEGVLGRGDGSDKCIFKVVNGSCYGIDITVFDAIDYSGGIDPEAGFIYCRTSLVCSDALIGISLANQGEFEIEEMKVSFGNLNKWTKKSSVKCLSGFYKNEETKTFTWTDIPSLRLYKDSEIEIKINFESFATNPYSQSEDFTIKQRCTFSFVNKAKLPGFFYETYSDTLRRIISLCTYSNTDIEYCLFKSPSGIICHHVFNKKKINLKFSKKELNDMYYILSFDKFIIHSHELVKKHIHFELISPEVSGLFYHFEANMLHEKFSMIAEALEELHRDTNLGTDQLGFKNRIIKMLEKSDYLLSHIGDKDIIADKVRDHRDYYTHWFDKKRNLVLGGDDLLILTLDIYILLVASLLNELGLDEYETLDAILGNMMFSSHLSYNHNEKSLPLLIERKVW